MRTIELSTVFDAPPETVIEHVGRSELLHYVTRGMLRFAPTEPDRFPERWEDGSYRARMYW